MLFCDNANSHHALHFSAQYWVWQKLFISQVIVWELVAILVWEVCPSWCSLTHHGHLKNLRLEEWEREELCDGRRETSL